MAGGEEQVTGGPGTGPPELPASGIRIRRRGRWIPLTAGAVVLAGVGVLAGLWGSPAPSSPPSSPTVGFPIARVTPAPAPALDLEAIDGPPLHLSDLRGRVVLLNLWATWCVPCREEMPALDALARDLGPRGLVVVGVNHQESAGAVAGFLRETGVGFPVYLDPDGVVADRYRATGVPVTWVIDREGRLRGAAAGYRDWNGPAARAYLEPLLAASPTAAVDGGAGGGRTPVAAPSPPSPTLADILRTHWVWRLEVLLPLGLAGGLYVLGFRRLRARTPGGRGVASPWRLAAYLGGLYLLALALLSPLDALAELSLTAHMIQHQLLGMLAPPLLLLGNPYPVMLWGLPPRLRRVVARPLAQGRPLRAVWRGLTALPVAWPLYVATLVAWHLPAAYDLALRVPALHDLEHLMFTGTALVFWWPVVDPAPRLHRLTTGWQYGLRIAYLVLATAATTLIGAVLGLAERVLYPTYAAAPPLGGWTPLDDQAFAGGVMWSSSHLFLIAILVLLGQAMDAEGRAEMRARPGAIV